MGMNLFLSFDVAALINAFWMYSFYLLVLFAVSSKFTYPMKSRSRIVGDFFEYVKKGRRRVASIGDVVYGFGVLQLLYVVPYLVLGMNFWVWFAASAIMAYGFALFKDNMKRHRHNGINIGYEYPHPVENEPLEVQSEDDSSKLFRTVHVGSKGEYDLQIKSEPNPHAMIIGETGLGKTTLAVTFLARAYERFKIPFLIIDWGGTYKDEINVNRWHVPNNLKVNPFRLRGMSAERRSGIAAELLQFSLGLTDLQMQKVRETLMQMYQEGGEPDLVGLHDRILKEMREAKTYREIRLQLQYVANKLRMAFEIFGDEPEVFWDNYDKTCCIVDLHGLTDAEKKLVTYTIMQRIIEEFKARNDVKMYIALDDAYQALLDYYGKETNITKIVREGRKYGFGLMITTQMMKDLPQAIIANTSMKFVFSYHEPYEVEKIHRMLKMSEMEKEMLHRMPKGSCLLFDQSAIQGGKVHPAYIEVDKLGRDEKETISGSIQRLEIGGMKFERGNSNEEIRMPQVSIYRFLVAMHRTGGDPSGAVKWLTGRRLITSTRTLYGGGGVEPLFDRVRNAGFIGKDGRLSREALRMVDPKMMVLVQGDRKGGEDHVAMMQKIIEMEQEKGNFAFVPAGEEGFDVGAIGTGGRKGAWNNSKVSVYEIQTTYIRSEVENCIKRARNRRHQLTFVTNSARVKKEIEQMAGGQYNVMKIRPYPDA